VARTVLLTAAATDNNNNKTSDSRIRLGIRIWKWNESVFPKSGRAALSVPGSLRRENESIVSPLKMRHNNNNAASGLELMLYVVSYPLLEKLIGYIKCWKINSYNGLF